METRRIAEGWPKEPYKGFCYYNFEDSVLFVGRENDVEDCAAYLAEPRTRTLLLHGQTGCGKSSFLRAGLIPALESRGFGFVFLRRNEGEHPALIRCTAEPMTRFAEELFWFTEQPRVYQTAVGSRTIDIKGSRQGKDDIRTFAESCREPQFLMNVLTLISEKLLHTLVVILDQAEEAINQREGGSAFFDFLKLFNGASINVKLVIALRTERFGEFFGYLHFGASVITDVKQYFLQQLDRPRVKRAIEMPTSTELIGGQCSPFGVYGFSYEPDLVDRIVSDLFSAPPSGGILPLMQVVCRGLYHEVRNASPPRVVSAEIYESGGGVAGRVDKQIGQSLRAAIRKAHPSIRSLDAEERKWRTGLYKLVRMQPDGTIGTDLKTEQELYSILRDCGVSDGVSAILTDLADPEVLILRQVKVISSESGADIVLYGLGHDAIGLVLRQWILRADEAEKARLAVMRAQKRTRSVRAVGLIVLAAFFVSLAYIGELTWRRKTVEISVLRAFAESRFRSDPSTATSAVVRAANVAESIWFKDQRQPRETLLPDIAATLPQNTVRSSLSQVPSIEGYVLPAARKFAFWNPREGLEIASWDGLEQSRFDLAALFGSMKALQDISLQNATETPQGTMLFRFAFSPGREAVVVIRDRKLVGVYDTAYFMGLSEDVRALFRKQDEDAKSAENSGASNLIQPLRLSIDSNIVYLSRWMGLRSIAMTAFLWEADGNAGAFHVGARMSNTSEPETVNRRFTTLQPGRLLLYTFVPIQRGSGSDDKDRRRALADLRVYDLRSEAIPDQEAWSLATSNEPTLKDCLNRAEPSSPPLGPSDTSDSCLFKVVSHDTSSYLLVMVPPRRQVDAAGEVKSGSRAGETSAGSLVIVDIATRQSTVVDISKIEQSAEGSVFGPKRGSLDFHSLVAGGVYESVIMGIRSGEIIDVVRINKGQPSFVGTYVLSDGPASRVEFSLDGLTMASIGRGSGALWNLSESASERRGVLAKEPAELLVRKICASRLTAGSENNWLQLTGLGIGSSDPCPAK